MIYGLCRLALVTGQPITAFGLEPDAQTIVTLITCHRDLQWEAENRKK